MTLERNPSASERERVERMRAAWRADKPSDVEVERARSRWLAQVHVSPTRGRPRALLVAAIVFGAAGALAATGAVSWRTASGDRAVAQPNTSAQPTAQARSAPSVPRAVAARVTTPRATALAPDPTQPPKAVFPAKRTFVAPSAPDSGSAPKPGSPPVARFALPGDAAAVPAQPSGSAPISAEREPTNAARPSGAWQRAADALRRGDDYRATEALQELAASPDPYTRDSAALAKAQLDAAEGRWHLALPVLRRLATLGATPLLQRRAAEVLAQGPRPQ